jgi:hypothetical protein
MRLRASRSGSSSHTRWDDRMRSSDRALDSNNWLLELALSDMEGTSRANKLYLRT